MEQKTVFLIILGMAAVTYLPRLLPVLVLSSKSLPPVVIMWLQYVPVAVLAAMLLPALMMPDKQIDLSFNNLFLWASIPTILAAWRTKSFFGTVLVGMGTVALVRFFF
jgi:branched-subunit amino acid transport protein